MRLDKHPFRTIFYINDKSKKEYDSDQEGDVEHFFIFELILEVFLLILEVRRDPNRFLNCCFLVR